MAHLGPCIPHTVGPNTILTDRPGTAAVRAAQTAYMHIVYYQMIDF